MVWAWLKRVFSGASGLCIPDKSQHVSISPDIPKLSHNLSTQQQPQHTSNKQVAPQATIRPIRVDPKAAAAAADRDELEPSETPTIRQHPQSQQDTAAEDDQSDTTTPPNQLPQQGRYIVSGGMPVGIANTVSKYKETQPLVPHLTPFEKRVAAKLTEEQQVARAAAAAARADAGTGAGADGSNHHNDRIKQKLFPADGQTVAAAVGAAGGGSRAT